MSKQFTKKFTITNPIIKKIENCIAALLEGTEPATEAINIFKNQINSFLSSSTDLTKAIDDIILYSLIIEELLKKKQEEDNIDHNQLTKQWNALKYCCQKLGSLLKNLEQELSEEVIKILVQNNSCLALMHIVGMQDSWPEQKHLLQKILEVTIAEVNNQVFTYFLNSIKKDYSQYINWLLRHPENLQIGTKDGQLFLKYYNLLRENLDLHNEEVHYVALAVRDNKKYWIVVATNAYDDLLGMDDSIEIYSYQKGEKDSKMTRLANGKLWNDNYLNPLKTDPYEKERNEFAGLKLPIALDLEDEEEILKLNMEEEDINKLKKHTKTREEVSRIIHILKDEELTPTFSSSFSAPFKNRKFFDKDNHLKLEPYISNPLQDSELELLKNNGNVKIETEALNSLRPKNSFCTKFYCCFLRGRNLGNNL